ncbi:MAG TPA: DUF6311 domain-containing protein [Alphaproteobacteria bacterium]|nr:DUF6311 domain-containing protein [Alphaproteobacteria bacterium]
MQQTSKAGLEYSLSALIGLILAAVLFTPPVLLGTGPFWDAPNYPDMQQHLSAARYFLHDSWRFPVFLTRLIMPPDGVSVVFLDVNPLLAFLAKVWFKLTGLSVNYFGPWIAICYALQGAAFLYLCRSLGLRGVVPAVVCAAIALSVPEFLYRYFHLNLLGQFLITFQLGFYFRAVRGGRYRAMSWWALGLALTTILIHFYTFAMVAGIYAALLAEYAFARRGETRTVLAHGAIFAVGTAALLVGSGYLHGAGGSTGFGHFSMNILSPFVPQDSGVLPFMHDMIDATGGQYEGFNYLGLGILALFVIALVLYRRDLWTLALRYRFLLLMMIAFTAFAISFNPMIGDIALLHPFAHPATTAATAAAPAAPVAAPHPASLGQKLHDLIFYPLQQFRSSGRFFWPVGYLMAAFGIVGVWRRMPGPAGLAILAVAALLQFIDAGPLRREMSVAIRTPASTPVGGDPWVKLIAAHREITVLPSMDCADTESPLIPLFVFYASESITPTHSAKLSRGPKADCPAEFGGLAHRQLGADEIVVLLSPPIPEATIQAMPDAGELCRKFSLGYVCSRKWAELDAAGIRLTDRDLGPPGPMPYNPLDGAAGHRPPVR